LEIKKDLSKLEHGKYRNTFLEQKVETPFSIYFCTYQRVGGGMEHNETVHKLFIDFKKAYDSVRSQIMYNILIQY
jgi:hypothetical protein